MATCEQRNSQVSYWAFEEMLPREQGPVGLPLNRTINAFDQGPGKAITIHPGDEMQMQVVDQADTWPEPALSTPSSSLT